MRTADLDYDLPADLIAQRPAEPRDSARLLVAGPSGPPRHRLFSDLPSELRPDDLVVLNDTRVLPVRLRLRRATGGAAEVLLLEPLADGRWEALVRPFRRLREGERLDSGGLSVEIAERLGEGRALVALHADVPIEQALERAGEMPLPPYITEPPADPADYQTVYARDPGSAAAPTAGLHFTTALLEHAARVAPGGGGDARRRPRHLPAGRRGRSRRARDPHRALPGARRRGRGGAGTPSPGAAVWSR